MEMIKVTAGRAILWIKGLFVKKSEFSEKREINFGRLKLLAFMGVVIFIVVVLFLPDDPNVEFSSKIDTADSKKDSAAANVASDKNATAAQSLWAPQRINLPSKGAANQNTSMVLTQKGGNAKTQLRAGIRVPLRILDKFIVSDSAVPILAEAISNVSTDSGLTLPAGTKFYGEASHQKDSDRATIHFSQISLPSGEIRPISAIGLGKDSQPGIPGTVHSDAMKNTAGQMITTFVGGFAAGSMQTNFLGGSQGGVQNGVLNAVAATAKDRAQDYGEKLKNERQWIEVLQGAECDAAFSDSLNLQTGGDVHE
jgi:hypothetical protein